MQGLPDPVDPVYNAQMGCPIDSHYGKQQYEGNIKRPVPSSAGPSVLPRRAPFALNDKPHPEAHPDRAALHERGDGKQD